MKAKARAEADAEAKKEGDDNNDWVGRRSDRRLAVARTRGEEDVREENIGVEARKVGATSNAPPKVDIQEGG